MRVRRTLSAFLDDDRRGRGGKWAWRYLLFHVRPKDFRPKVPDLFRMDIRRKQGWMWRPSQSKRMEAIICGVNDWGWHYRYRHDNDMR